MGKQTQRAPAVYSVFGIFRVESRMYVRYKQNPNLEPGKQQMLATPSVKWVEKSETKFVLFGSQGKI